MHRPFTLASFREVLDNSLSVLPTLAGLLTLTIYQITLTKLCYVQVLFSLLYICELF